MSDARSKWKRVKLGEVALNSTAATKDPVSDGFSRYVIGRHIPADGGRIQTWNPVGDAEFGSRIRTMFQVGDVICTTRGPFLKVAVADFAGLSAHTNFILRTRDSEILRQAMLEAIARSEGFQAHLRKHFRGSTNLFVNWSDAAQYEFELPPIKEQDRMVSIFSATEEVWRTTNYLAGCSRMLFHATLERVHTEALARFPAVPLVDAVDPDRAITYGILMPGTGFPGGVPVIKVKDFPDGNIAEDDLLLTDPAIAHEYRRSRLRSGDILVSIRGTIGRVAVVPEHLEGANITQDTARLSFGGNSNIEYLRAMLESPTVQRKMHSNIPPPSPPGMPPPRAKPRPTIQGLNIGELRRVAIPVPPKAVQDQFAEITESARTTVSLTAARAAQARELWTVTLREILGTNT